MTKAEMLACTASIHCAKIVKVDQEEAENQGEASKMMLARMDEVFERSLKSLQWNETVPFKKFCRPCTEKTWGDHACSCDSCWQPGEPDYILDDESGNEIETPRSQCMEAASSKKPSTLRALNASEREVDREVKPSTQPIRRRAHWTMIVMACGQRYVARPTKKHGFRLLLAAAALAELLHALAR